MNDYADRERCYLFVVMTELTLGQTDSHAFFLSQYLAKAVIHLFVQSKEN